MNGVSATGSGFGIAGGLGVGVACSERYGEIPPADGVANGTFFGAADGMLRKNRLFDPPAYPVC